MSVTGPTGAEPFPTGPTYSLPPEPQPTGPTGPFEPPVPPDPVDPVDPVTPTPTPSLWDKIVAWFKGLFR